MRASINPLVDWVIFFVTDILFGVNSVDMRCPRSRFQSASSASLLIGFAFKAEEKIIGLILMLALPMATYNMKIKKLRSTLSGTAPTLTHLTIS